MEDLKAMLGRTDAHRPLIEDRMKSVHALFDRAAVELRADGIGGRHFSEGNWPYAWTENPCVGGSIPPLATIPLQALRLVFGLVFCFSEFCIGISGQYKFHRAPFLLSKSRHPYTPTPCGMVAVVA